MEPSVPTMLSFCSIYCLFDHWINPSSLSLLEVVEKMFSAVCEYFCCFLNAWPSLQMLGSPQIFLLGWIEWKLPSSSAGALGMSWEDVRRLPWEMWCCYAAVFGMAWQVTSHISWGSRGCLRDLWRSAKALATLSFWDNINSFCCWRGWKGMDLIKT